MPASQYTWMVLSGPSGSRCGRLSGCVSAIGGWPPLTASRSTTVAIATPLADAGEPLTLQHVNDSAPADGRFQHDETRGVRYDLAHHARLSTLRRPLHRSAHPRGVRAWERCEQLALVGAVEGIEAEELAHTTAGLAHGDRSLVQNDTDARLPRKLVQRGGDSTAGGV